MKLLCTWTLVALVSCTTPRQSAYSTPNDVARDTTTAEALTREAAALLSTEPELAELLLRDALTADLFYGPAHNNLGILYLQQERLYEAANEFEWSRKLLPGHPDPRLNLGLTLERAGYVDEAMASYESALAVAPEHLPTLQAFARMLAWNGLADERLDDMLDTISLRGEDASWRNWAMSQRLARQ